MFSQVLKDSDTRQSWRTPRALCFPLENVSTFPSSAGAWVIPGSDAVQVAGLGRCLPTVSVGEGWDLAPAEGSSRTLLSVVG